MKPLHCKMVLNLMDDHYAGSTIRQAYIMMGTMFRSALMNDLITKHPMNGVRYTKPVRAADDIKCLTVEEQQRFLEAAKRSHNYSQYAFLLETGLRTGELIGLTWDAIESGMRPKVLQKLLGHSSIKTTMDRYVHATDDSLVSAVQQFERYHISENRAAAG